ncbi:phosphoglycerate mutase-like protein [Dacryopinax primogenitus]|uniref:Phosphoglycerate mutase-like protein n=1 Tax=Dacryopinax primogenitus (strain DJM 731) TaxID=1858805 RepID=M5GDZ7_DACPD|nr:phosphoglycerate mutase-like protein [Dacryopinax primogenitus]EJU02843.1 phosphoglycerate mutase-like protein [Dacryopinax primogenitus]
MPPKRMPKVYIVRHGETEWSLNGRHTGTTDLPLTANGEATILKLGEKVAGPGKLLDPSLISTTLVSPRLRAQRTFALLFSSSPSKPSATTDQRVREWTYGDYEGFYAWQAAASRAERGIPSGEDGWDIWVDGCEGGESAQEMSDRADEVVRAVKDSHKAWYESPEREEGDVGGDVLIVSHGHFSRCFLTRWLGLPLKAGQLFVLDTGGVCVGQYYHGLDKTSLGAMNLGLI